MDCEPIEAIDINTPEDLALARLVADGEHEQEARRLRAFREVLTSEILCDILGRDCCKWSGIASSTSKALGRARTLTLGDIDDNELLGSSIYDALESYEWVNTDDIIVAKNDASRKYAYFGEINARIAKRRGASGFITDGPTRDEDAVYRLGFPTWSGGHLPWDVKTTAKLKSIGQPVRFRGMTIEPGQLVFADSCGIVAIPRDREDDILSEAMESFAKENRIIEQVARNKCPMTIIRDQGRF